MSSPSPPKATAAQVEQENEQTQASALLDKQENDRRKRLLNAAAGIRAFNGSAIGRAAPGNTAMAAGAPSAAQVASTGGSFATPVNGGGNFGLGGGGRVSGSGQK